MLHWYPQATHRDSILFPLRNYNLYVAEAASAKSEQGEAEKGASGKRHAESKK